MELVAYSCGLTKHIKTSIVEEKTINLLINLIITKKY